MIYETCLADSAVTTIFGTNPLRVYGWGLAPQGVQRPYMVWQAVTGSPENNISESPDFDMTTIQVDVYADTAAKAKSGSKVIQNAIERVMNVVSLDGEDRDPVTNDYRVTFSVDWFVPR